MKKTGVVRRNGEVLFLVLLFGLFILSALSVMLLGARVYEKIKENMDSHYTGQTASAYVTEKIRQHDEKGMVSLRRIHKKDVLVLTKKANGVNYATYLYEDNHYIKELFAKEGTNPDLSYGEKILKVGNFSIGKEGNLYRIQVEDEEGKVTVRYISTRTEGEENK